MIWFVPSSRYPTSRQGQLSGGLLLVAACLGLILTVAEIYQHRPHSSFLFVRGRADASAAIAMLTVAAAVFGVLIARMYWWRYRWSLTTARARIVHRVRQDTD